MANFWNPGSLEFDESPPAAEPLQTPVTILDLERGPMVDMMLPMSDPCPSCGATNMLVGDWVCWGTCIVCYETACNNAER